MQDFEGYELVIHDDASGGWTPEVLARYSDPRIRIITAEKNIGGEFGDTEIVRRLQETCKTPYVIHMNDDDYYCKPDLFSTQIQLFEEVTGLAMVIGGIAQKYDHYIPLPGPAQPWHKTRYVGHDEDTVFVENVYPSGVMSGRQFLELFAEDYPNRNIVHGATMFRSEFLTPDLFNREFAWQAGAALDCGMATKGGVAYIDSPCLMNRVDIDCASFRGTQKMHYEQCLASIDAGYANVMNDPEMKKLRDKTALSATWAYLGNKISNRNGAFKNNPLGDISRIMRPEILSAEFLAALARHNVPLTAGQTKAIEFSDLSLAEMA
jgi:hypothetical protein